MIMNNHFRVCFFENEFIFLVLSRNNIYINVFSHELFFFSYKLNKIINNTCVCLYVHILQRPLLSNFLSCISFSFKILYQNHLHPDEYNRPLVAFSCRIIIYICICLMFVQHVTSLSFFFCVEKN